MKQREGCDLYCYEDAVLCKSSCPAEGWQSFSPQSCCVFCMGCQLKSQVSQDTCVLDVKDAFTNACQTGCTSTHTGFEPKSSSQPGLRTAGMLTTTCLPLCSEHNSADRCVYTSQTTMAVSLVMFSSQMPIATGSAASAIVAVSSN